MVVRALVLCVLVSVVVESFCEEQGGGLIEDFSGAGRGDGGRQA